MTFDPIAKTRFGSLRAFTQARIDLARTGHAIATTPMLDFQYAHARARQAVLRPLDVVGLVNDLASGEEAPICVRSRAETRLAYLQRPDLGRLLDPGDAAGIEPGPFDAVIIVADGLSAIAVERHAPATVTALRSRLVDWRFAPTVIATQARVALGDSIGECLAAELSIVLIGERPGLSAADSLGAYLTFAPQIGRRDHERNCVSNIRPPDGLSYADAADRIVWLARSARRLRLTGVGLKEDFVTLPTVKPTLAGLRSDDHASSG